MVKQIVADICIHETRVALLEDKELVELHIEHYNEDKLVGNIYRGKVTNVLPGMQSAFIDIGYEKNAFLFISDTTDAEPQPIETLYKQGQEVTVQVIKEPFGSKGPRLTTNISIPGKYLVLLPRSNYIGVSKKISGAKERERLKDITNSIKNSDMGFIVRTEAEGKSEEELQHDFADLMKIWNGILQKEEKGNVPRCLYHEAGILSRVVREVFTNHIDKFVINDWQTYEHVLSLVEDFSSEMKLKVTYYNKEYEIFDYYQIESQISKALSRQVWLKSGGFLVFDRTEAFTIIDVNTGKFTGKKNHEETVYKTNTEAAWEIAKQIRIRDVGGIIIIDFIDMSDKDHQNEIISVLKEAFKKDHARTTVVGITGLGLVEMTRKKERNPLETIMTVPCPVCKGKGIITAPETVGRNIEKHIRQYFIESKAETIIIELSPSLVEVFTGKNDELLKKFELKYKKRFIINKNESLKDDLFKIKELWVGE